MKRLGVVLFPVLAVALMLGVSGTALAQNVGDNSVYFVTYYSNANTTGAPDGTVRVINDGDTGANLWASFYVFDDSEELQDCCSCPVTPDGLLSESVNTELANFDYVLTPKLNHRGVIKVISSSTPAGGPSYTNTLAAGLRVWSSHIQRASATAGAFYNSETAAADSNLSASEKQMLEALCEYEQELGSGFGVCTCTPEDHDY